MLACVSSDGSSANQTCKDEGPLTLDRSRTVDEEISSHVIDFLDRNDPKKTNKPFFVWYNPARMHITTMFSPEYQAMLGEEGGKDWGINEVGMKQLDNNIGDVLKKLEDMGELDNTIVVFTTDNGAESQTFPDGGMTPFKAGKLTTWEGGMRVPLVIRWPGHIKPGTVFTDIFASLDWLPTLVEIAGGPKGNDLKSEIEKGQYPGIVKTHLDGVNQLAYLEGKSDKSARDTFFYYTGATSSAVRYRTGRSISRWKVPPVQAHWPVHKPTVGRRSRTSNVIRTNRRWAGQSRSCRRRCPCLPEHGLSLQLEHVADRPTALVAGTLDLHRLPGAAGSGEL